MAGLYEPPPWPRALVALDLEPRHAPEVLDVSRHDRHLVGEAGRGDPEVVRADQVAVVAQVSKGPAKLPAHLGVDCYVKTFFFM